VHRISVHKISVHRISASVVRSIAKPAMDDADDEDLIECRNVYKSFGEKQILQGASFKVMLLNLEDFIFSMQASVLKGIMALF
jgi:hypothetical protein